MAITWRHENAVANVSGGNVYSTIGFTAPPGASVRCHVWDIT